MSFEDRYFSELDGVDEPAIFFNMHGVETFPRLGGIA
jgi:hypothetical protein